MRILLPIFLEDVLPILIVAGATIRELACLDGARAQRGAPS